MRPALSLVVLLVTGCAGQQGADGNAVVRAAEDAAPNDGGGQDIGTDGAFGGQPVASALIFRSYRVISVFDGMSQGFDLDGVASLEGEGSGCRRQDAVAPDGTVGIDNGVGRLWTDFYEVLGDPVESLFREAVSRGGEIPLLVMPTDGPSLFGWSRLDGAAVDFDGLLAGYQTFDLERGGGSPVVSVGLEALSFGPFNTNVRVVAFSIELDFEVEGLRGKLWKRSDGVWLGTVGGTIPLNILPESLLGVSSLVTNEPLFDAMTRLADSEPVGASCSRISFAAEVEAVEGFAVGFR